MELRDNLRHWVERTRRGALHAADLCKKRCASALRFIAVLPATKAADASTAARSYFPAAAASKGQRSRVVSALSAATATLAPRLRPAVDWIWRGLRPVADRCAVLAAPLLKMLGAQPQVRRALDTLPLTRSCFAIATANLLEQRLRLVAALSGVAAALFLLMLQISVLDATRAKVTALFDDFKFDLVILPDTYQFLLSFDTVDRIVLDIARATGDTAATYGLNVGVVHWTEEESKRETYNFLIGLDDPGRFVRDRDILDGWSLLTTPHLILADRYSQPSVGPVAIGTNAKINQERVTVAGQFRLGLFFYAEGAAIVRNINFAHLALRDSSKISMGLLQLNPGVSPEKAKADLIKALPSDTLVLTRSELLRDERAYFLTTKPIGIMIYISMVIACLVAVAIIMQVLSTDISNRMKEYAVLKAMGAGPPFVYGVGFAQAVLLGLCGLLPAILVSALVLAFVQFRTHLQTALDIPHVLEILAITLALAIVAGAAVVRRVQHADPAELY